MKEIHWDSGSLRLRLRLRVASSADGRVRVNVFSISTMQAAVGVSEQVRKSITIE